MKVKLQIIINGSINKYDDSFAESCSEVSQATDMNPS